MNNSPYRALLWWVLAVLLTVALTAGFVKLSQARVMSEQECAQVANDAGAIASWRDQGIPESTAEEAVVKVLLPLVGDSTYYVQTNEEVAFMVHLLHSIYASKTPPQDIAHSVFEMCTKAGPGKSHNIKAPVKGVKKLT